MVKSDDIIHFKSRIPGVTLPGEQTFVLTVADIWTCPLEKTPVSLFTEPDCGH